MSFGQRLRSRFWRPKVEDEVDAELDFHVEMRTRELIAQGMDPAAARTAAVGRFGDINQGNEACRALCRQKDNDNDMRRTEYWSELVQDVTFAFRHFVSQPGFTAVALLTLAIGIGATSAIFSAVHAVVLQPLQAYRVLGGHAGVVRSHGRRRHPAGPTARISGYRSPSRPFERSHTTTTTSQSSGA
jgi:hypothetical protein